MTTDSLPSVQTMIKELEPFYLENDAMNEWQAEFYESLTIQLHKGRELSEKQIDKLAELYERFCCL